MSTPLEKVYRLNPDYVLRNDEHRIVLFSKATQNNSISKNWYGFIHPLQAVMLSFFTYNRSLGENLELLAEFFNRDITYMEKMIVPYLNNPTPIYTLWKGQKIHFPKNLLIEAEKTDGRCRFPQLNAETFFCKDVDLVSKRFYSGPLLLTLMLTNRCLTHCRYCYADTSTRSTQLPTSRLLELIREAAAIQVQQVNLIGGEVFLHKDWDIILKELVRLGIAPDYISTKVPFTEEIIERLKNTGYNNLIQVSLDACDSAILQDLLNVRENYCDRVLEGIRLLDRNGFNYQVASVLTTYNCRRETLMDIYRFLSTLHHLREWRLVPVSNSLAIEYKDILRLKPGRNELINLFDYMETALLPGAGFNIMLGKQVIEEQFQVIKDKNTYFKGGSCSGLNHHMFVLPDGKVTICEQLYWKSRFIIGDVTRNSLKEVWNSPRSSYLSRFPRADIQKSSACKTCNLFEECFNTDRRCWSDIIKAYGEECWDFPDPHCQFAPDMKNSLAY